MNRKQWDKKTVWILAAGTAVVFLFFALISHWTPVSGDDWVYAVGGMWNNPFKQAFHMYQTWSGRYLSELWGFLIAPHKGLWNLLNPLVLPVLSSMKKRNLPSLSLQMILYPSLSVEKVSMLVWPLN